MSEFEDFPDARIPMRVIAVTNESVAGIRSRHSDGGSTLYSHHGSDDVENVSLFPLLYTSMQFLLPTFTRTCTSRDMRLRGQVRPCRPLPRGPIRSSPVLLCPQEQSAPDNTVIALSLVV